MQDLEKVRYITANYQYLQGLKMVPVGMAFLLMGLLNLGWLQTLEGPIMGLLILVSVVAMFALYRWSNRYYENNFGQAQPVGYGKLRTIIALLIIVALFAALFIIEEISHASISIVGLGAAAFMFAYYWPKRRFAGHYIVMAALIAIASLLPLVGIPPNYVSFGTKLAIYQIGVGLIYIVGGMFDHLLLVRAMRPVEEVENGTAI